MKKFATIIAAATLAAGAAQAGGIDRSGQSISPIFEETGENGGYAAFGFGVVSPTAGSPNAGSDPLGTYSAFTMAYKQELSDALSLTVIVDQPFGADVNYGSGPFAGGGANISTNAITGVLRYTMGNGFSVHGGIRAQEASGAITTVLGGVPYSLTAGSDDLNFGGLIGVAYERPDIALRVALTYNSAITQKMTGVEGIAAGPNAGVRTKSFDVKFPESWNLEFQSGVAADTLVFGSIRYAEWAGFNMTTGGVGGAQYVSFNNNSLTYSLGLGRRFNENWSGAVTLGYEKAASAATTTPLAPTAGNRTIGLGATYTQGNTTVTGGVTFGKMEAQTFNAGPLVWNNNSVVGAGIKLGFRF